MSKSYTKAQKEVLLGILKRPEFWGNPANLSPGLMITYSSLLGKEAITMVYRKFVLTPYGQRMAQKWYKEEEN